MEIEIARTEVGSAANAGDRGGVGASAGTRRAKAPAEKSVILKGGGLLSVVRKENAFSQPSPSREEALIGFIQREYEASKAIIDNLKPSEREIENIERRLRELKELELMIRDGTVAYEEARKIFINMLDAEDLAAFRTLTDKAAEIIVG